MILFINTYLVPTKAYSSCIWDRGNLSEPCKLDTFKYSISSLASCYPWSKVVIYFLLHEEYKPREEELISHIKSEFEEQSKDIDIVIRNTRNVFQKEWQETYGLFNNDNLIFYSGNHDHIFIGEENLFKLAVEEFRSKLEIHEGVSSLRFSHFPELFRSGLLCNHPESDDTELESLTHIHKSVVSNSDAIQILSKDLYYKWFWNNDYGDAKIGRTDGPDTNLLYGAWNPRFSWPAYSMNYEHIRHFDGYNHVQIGNEKCPALDIPQGYFDKTIRVKFGYNDYYEDCLNVNPFNKKSYAECKSGVDFRYSIEELPSHIKKRISEIDVSPNFNYNDFEIAIQLYRNRLDFASKSCLSSYGLEGDLFSKHGISPYEFSDYINYDTIYTNGMSGIKLLDKYINYYYKKYDIESFNND